MKIYTQIEIQTLIDGIACYYSKTGDNSFDNGVNETIKDVCKTLIKFEKEKGMDSIEYHTKIFAGVC